MESLPIILLIIFGLISIGGAVITVISINRNDDSFNGPLTSDSQSSQSTQPVDITGWMNSLEGRKIINQLIRNGNSVRNNLVLKQQPQLSDLPKDNKPKDQPPSECTGYSVISPSDKPDGCIYFYGWESVEVGDNKEPTYVGSPKSLLIFSDTE